ncbi:MAG TPA: BBP7 family outer membrane beta-barrel protein, partial [Gemmatales bacterium]|nr:BBP7 family outer membrane beta-barrel protein [Gemmatales bacterium]
PELGLWVGYDLTSFCRFTVGYDVLFINRIMRPNGNPLTNYGNGTIQNLGTSQAVFGPAVSNFVENRLFVYGISFGAEVRF